MLKKLFRIWKVYFFVTYFLYGLTEGIKELPYWINWEPGENETEKDEPYKFEWAWQSIFRNVKYFIKGL